MRNLAFFGLGAILFLSSCNKEPSVAFSASATEITAGESINFTNESDDATFSTAWSFGDGGDARTWDASHVFQVAGEYTVTLTGASRRGNNTATATKKIKVNERPSQDVEIEPEFADQMVGVWSLNAASYFDNPCVGTTNSLSDNANARKFRYIFVSAGTGYYITNNGEQNRFNVTLLNEITADVTGFELPMGNQFVFFPSGLYQITLTGTDFTFTRTEERYDSFNNCYDTETYTFVLKK